MENKRQALLRNSIVSLLIIVSTTGPCAAAIWFGRDGAKTPVPNVASFALDLYLLNAGRIALDHPNLLGGWAHGFNGSEEFLKMTRTMAAMNPRLTAVQFTRVDRDSSPFERIPSIVVLPLLVDPTMVERESNQPVGLNLNINDYQNAYKVVDATKDFLAQMMTHLRRGQVIRAQNVAQRAFDNLADSGGVLTLPIREAESKRLPKIR
jgi:hypothetical protein